MAQVQGISRNRTFPKGMPPAKSYGIGTSDSVHGVSLSPGEAVLPAQTVQTVGSGNVANLIAKTTGKAPKRGINRGGKYASGVVDDTTGQPGPAIPQGIVKAASTFGSTDLGSSASANEMHQLENSGNNAQAAGVGARGGIQALGEGIADTAKAATLPIQAVGYGIGNAAGAVSDSGGRFLKGLFGIQDTPPTGAPTVAAQPVAATPTPAANTQPPTTLATKFKPFQPGGIDYSKFGNMDAGTATAAPSGGYGVSRQPSSNGFSSLQVSDPNDPSYSYRSQVGVQPSANGEQAYTASLDLNPNMSQQTRNQLLENPELANKPGFGINRPEQITASNTGIGIGQPTSTQPDTSRIGLATGIYADAVAQARAANPGQTENYIQGAAQHIVQSMAGLVGAQTGLENVSGENGLRTAQTTETELKTNELQQMNELQRKIEDPNTPEKDRGAALQAWYRRTGKGPYVAAVNPITQEPYSMNTLTGQVNSLNTGGQQVSTRPIGTISTVDGKSARWDGQTWIPQ